MEEHTSRLHSIALSESEENNKVSDDKPIKTNEMNVYKIYDLN